MELEPNIKVIFQTLATTAIERSERGKLCILIDDDTNTDTWTTLEGVEDIVADDWASENVQLLGTAFEVFTPHTVIIRRVGTDDIGTILKDVATKKATQLCYPGVSEEDDLTIVTWAKAQVEEQGTVYISTFATNSDSCAVVELNNTSFTHQIIEDYTPSMFTVMLGGAMAGCPLNRSLDNYIMPTLTAVDNVEYAEGKLSLYNDDDQVRIVLAVNSKTEFDSTWKENTRKIKVFEGMNIVRHDIEDTFKDNWVNHYINNYNNKMAFCNVVNKTYFPSLQPNVLDSEYDNAMDISSEMNKAKIVIDGKDPDDYTDAQIKRYNTADFFYATADVMFADTMAHLELKINY